MEGGSIAQVCYRNGVPCAVLRAISDNADDSGKVNFLEFARMASKKVRLCCRKLYRRFPGRGAPVHPPAPVKAVAGFSVKFRREGFVMEYRKFGDTIVLRLEVGEEIAESLAALCEKKSWNSARSAAGAAARSRWACLTRRKRSISAGNTRVILKLAALRGTLPEKKRAPTCTCIWYSEIPGRMSVAGHLNRAVISATAELFVRVLPGSVGRRMDDEVGLNLFQFSQDS